MRLFAFITLCITIVTVVALLLFYGLKIVGDHDAAIDNQQVKEVVETDIK